MQTVKIGDVEYPWPEDSKYFQMLEIEDYESPEKRPCFVPDGTFLACGFGDFDGIHIDDGNEALPIIASVAAMHFRLKAEQQYDLALTLRDEAAAKHAGQIGRMWEDAYDKWAKLAKGV